jgi:glutamyl-tRNA synthetase
MVKKETKDHQIRSLIRKNSLENAYRHNGKANLGSVISKLVAEVPEIKTSIKTLIPVVKSIVEEINTFSTEKQLSIISQEFPELLEIHEKIIKEKQLPQLPNATIGKVITRFPPEPNGYPHIGHAKAALIDEGYARMYKGKLLLRFDDTNPAKEKLEYYDAIRSGLEWLGIRPDLEKNSSDDLEIFYKYAENMIRSKDAYVCICKANVIRLNRYQKKGCSCRLLSVQENILRWKRMFNGYEKNEAILRLKGSMTSLNSAFRDPTLFRIIESEHPLKGKRFRVWPTYDFAVPISDSLDGVTHALRTKEYELRDKVYYHILDILKLRKPELIEFSRLEIKGSVISKRGLQALLKDGLVTGWDDPRLPTLLGLKRRGFHPESIREFIMNLGVSKSESETDWGLLETINRRRLDPFVKRYHFVPNPIELNVSNASHIKTRLKHHPEKDLGDREIESQGEFFIPYEDSTKFKIGDIIRLLGLYNVKIKSISESNIHGEYSGEDLLERIPKIQWVVKKNIDFSVKILDRLLINGKFNDFSQRIIQGFAEEECKNLKIDDIVQFVRFGFVRIDGPKMAILSHK